MPTYERNRHNPRRERGGEVIRFCYECSHKLWGDKFKEVLVNGEKKIMHKICAENLKRNPEPLGFDFQFQEEGEK